MKPIYASMDRGEIGPGETCPICLGIIKGKVISLLGEGECPYLVSLTCECGYAISTIVSEDGQAKSEIKKFYEKSLKKAVRTILKVNKTLQE